MPMAAPSGYKLERKWSLTHFLIGIFGAMAILGVMAKIFNFQAEVFGYLVTWKPVVLVGFMGEAFVFIIMGMLREFRYVPVDEDEDATTDATDRSGADDDPLGAELKSAEAELTEEAQLLATQIRATRETLSDQIGMLEQLQAVRNSLQQASETLSRQSETLGSNMEDLETLYDAQIPMVESVEDVQRTLKEESEQLSAEMVEARKAMRALRTQFAETAHRFEQFNEPSTASESTNAAPNSA